MNKIVYLVFAVMAIFYYSSCEMDPVQTPGSDLITYSIIYKANGATAGDVPAEQIKLKGEIAYLAGNTGSLVKEGFNFTGWNTSDDSQGTHFNTGDLYITDADLELFAEWTEAATNQPDLLRISSITTETNRITFIWTVPSENGFDRIDVTSTGENTSLSIETSANTRICNLSNLTADTEYTITTGIFDSGDSISDTASFTVRTTNSGAEEFIPIYTADNLDNVRNLPEQNYILMVDLDLSTDFPVWEPIGSVSTPFTGHFNGNGKSISNLSIPNPVAYSALFSAVSGGTIENLELIDVCIGTESLRNSHAAGLAGVTEPGTLISRCSVTGTIYGYYFYTGGLVAENGGTIENSSAFCSIIADSNYAGGVAGANTGDGTISGSFSTGSISGNSRIAGGLAGLNEGTILESYASGDVSGLFTIGGLIGENRHSVSRTYSSADVTALQNDSGGLIGFNTGSVSDSYATGNVNGDDHIGGLIGKIDMGSTIAYSYAAENMTSAGNETGGFIGFSESPIGTYTYANFYDTETTGLSSSEYAAPKTTAEMQTLSTFSDEGWDVPDVWNINENINNGYPYLTALIGSY